VSFRNLFEGWVPAETQPHLHNRVHVWVGADMLPSSSPNDPVFYLNHCNFDRAWSAWLEDATRPPYLPAQSAPDELFRHRIDDPMFSIFTGDDDDRWTPAPGCSTSPRPTLRQPRPHLTAAAEREVRRVSAYAAPVAGSRRLRARRSSRETCICE
jgi:hypothetical protein